MRLKLDIINPENFNKKEENKEDDVDIDVKVNDQCTWYIRSKLYETDDNFIDSDIIRCPVGHKLDRLHVDAIQITSQKQIDQIIQLLQNAKPCFKH